MTFLRILIGGVFLLKRTYTFSIYFILDLQYQLLSFTENIYTNTTFRINNNFVGPSSQLLKHMMFIFSIKTDFCGFFFEIIFSQIFARVVVAKNPPARWKDQWEKANSGRCEQMDGSQSHQAVSCTGRSVKTMGNVVFASFCWRRSDHLHCAHKQQKEKTRGQNALLKYKIYNVVLS